MSPVGWKLSPKVSLPPCRSPNDPRISPKYEKPCAQNFATPRASGPLTTSASASPPTNASSRLALAIFSWLQINPIYRQGPWGDISPNFHSSGYAPTTHNVRLLLFG